jgi:hypothetical protein
MLIFRASKRNFARRNKTAFGPRGQAENNPQKRKKENKRVYG